MATIQFTCPTCKQTLDASEEMFGQTVECPACDTPIFLEEAPPPIPQTRSVTTAKKTKVTIQRKKLEESRGRISQKQPTPAKSVSGKTAATTSLRLSVYTILANVILGLFGVDVGVVLGLVLTLSILTAMVAAFVYGIIGWVRGRREGSKKTIIFAVSGTVLSGVFLVLMLTIFGHAFLDGREKAELYQDLNELAAEMNASLPSMEGEGFARFDRVQVDSYQQIEFHYTLPARYSMMPLPYSFDSEAKKYIQEKYYESDDFRLLRWNNVRLKCIFLDQEGVPLAIIYIPSMRHP